jgi:hypothetical protein
MVRLSPLLNGVVLTLLVLAAAVSWATHPRMRTASLLLALGQITLMVVRRVRAARIGG